MSEAPRPETPSAVFDRLLVVLRAVMAGQAPPAHLEQIVTELQARFVQARDATRANIHGQGPEHVQKYVESIGRIEEAFQDVDGALKSCLEYVRSGVLEVGERSERWVIHAAWAQATAMDAYQQAELAIGPTQMPLINLMIRMKDGFVAGQYSRAQFEDSIRGARLMAEEAQKEIRAKTPRIPAEDGMIDAYERLRRVLQELGDAIPAGSEALDAAIQGVIDAGESVRAAMEELSTKILTQGPTRIEHANLVLNILAAHQAGQVPDEVLARAVEVFRSGMEAESAQIDQMLSLPTQSTALAEQAQKTRAAYEQHWPALELIEAYTGGDASKYDAAVKALIAAAEALADCREAYQQIGEVEGKVLCVKCGAGNAPDARACSKCGARIMQTSNSSSTMSFEEVGGEARGASELVMTENLYRLFEAVNAVAESKIEPDEFGDVLNWMAELVQEHLLGLPPAPAFSRDGMTTEQMEAVTALEDELSRHREDLVEGAEEFMTALNRLSCYLDDHEKSHLISGVQLVRDSAIRIQKAQGAIDGVAASFEAMKSGGAVSEEEEEGDEHEGSAVG